MSSRARIATVCQNGTHYPTPEENREYVLRQLKRAASLDPDLVCLPETFTTVGMGEASRDHAEPVPGPTTDACARVAREHRTYVICPIRTMRENRQWNSAVVIGRDGSIAGIYDKAQPVTTTPDYTVVERGITPGPATPPVFDLDFGRIGVQICFDAGFPETWQSLADQGVRLVVWSSAYDGGFSLRAYAYLHHYYVVTSVRTERSRIIDPLGAEIARTDEHVNAVCRDVNLDYAVCHWDFNYAIPDTVLDRYGPRVEISSDRPSGHFLISSNDPELTIRALKDEIGFETTAEYHDRHRRAYESLRADRPAAPQSAAHGTRPQYSKT